MSDELPRPLSQIHDDDLVAFGRSADVRVRELIGGARAIASALPEAEPGDQVIVLCRDRVAFAAALFGAWEAGFGVALPPNIQPETVRSIRHRPEVVTVLHDGGGPKGIDVRGILASAAPDATPLRPIDRARHIATIFTSGSTGEHRACAKTGAQLFGEVATLLAAFPQTAGARVLSVVPAHHIYGLLFGILLPTCGGGAFHRDGPRDVDGLAEALRAGVDVLVSVPAHLRSLRFVEADVLPKIARVFSSGAPLPADTATDLDQRAGWTVTEVLGSTETGGIAWRDRSRAPASPWRPFPGVTVSAGDGELMLLESPLLAKDVPQPFIGGDRVRPLEGGLFEHLGRADGVLKIGSTRVSVAELAARLAEIDGVNDAAVLPVEVGGARGVETWAAVVAPGLDAKTLRTALRKWLAPVVIPRRFRFVDALPRQDNGKLRREDLLALFETPMEDDRDGVTSPGVLSSPERSGGDA
jgi:acyl-coenzyme A synthetase/AMP-(fatty) acid ligase